MSGERVRDRGRKSFVALAVLGLAVSGCGPFGSHGRAVRSVNTGPTSAASSQPSPSPRPTPRTLTQSIAAARNSVVRIEQTTCYGSTGPAYASGSGFLVAPDLVATVDHVVAGAATLSVRAGHDVSRAVLVGSDPEKEVALLRLVHPFHEHGLTLATHRVQSEDSVAALGYPLGMPLTWNEGHISGLNRRIDFERSVLYGLFQYDAPTSPGDSGGPVINSDGRVVGLTEASAQGGQNVNYAVPATTARPLLSKWEASGALHPLQPCGTRRKGIVNITSQHPDAPGIAVFLDRHFSGINDGTSSLEEDPTATWAYQSAWSVLSGREQAQYSSLDDFAHRHSTTRIWDVTLEKASMVDATTDTADVAFTSTQGNAQGGGDTCTSWHLRYSMTLDQGWWHIDRANPLQGSGRACTSWPAGYSSDASVAPVPSAS